MLEDAPRAVGARHRLDELLARGCLVRLGQVGLWLQFFFAVSKAALVAFVIFARQASEPKLAQLGIDLRLPAGVRFFLSHNFEVLGLVLRAQQQ